MPLSFDDRILANIYLHELDAKVMEIKAGFDRPATRSQTKEYVHQHSVKQTLRRKIDAAEGEEREELIRQYKAADRVMKSVPAKCQDDKKIVYVRYADDFLIGVFGSRQDAESIKSQLKHFLADEYSLELSEEKTKITHTSEKVRFLGYDVAVRRDQTLKRKRNGKTGRTLLNTVELTVPLEDKVTKYLFGQEIVCQKPDGRLWPIAIQYLVNDYVTDMGYSEEEFGILAEILNEMESNVRKYALPLDLVSIRDQFIALYAVATEEPQKEAAITKAPAAKQAKRKAKADKERKAKTWWMVAACAGGFPLAAAACAVALKKTRVAS